ncbi:hypothetical protein KOR34_12920 [Posidoniimonas corsicana]|uniref:UPF0235 protein KOR34_12920 n=1 Tax=Posidoniimonas corsicana TaxID=1938618 RepID=A0A5C5VEN4_9BACT|nr:DUF167 domain-containing protein [Posidoniimonas corsicana]TWT36387.1 hypothetical protein KOR34_12920 [Posidoniimonas corsicana]
MSEPLELSPHPQGVVLAVKARAGGACNAVAGVRDGRLLVSVTQAPEKGKANAAIGRVIAKALGLRPSEVQLFAGPTNPQKRFLLVGADPDAVRQTVAELLAD